MELTQALGEDAAPIAGPFPFRVAAIDIGSNAIRFLAAEFQQPMRYTVLEQTRTPVRLGRDVFLTGRLHDAAVAAAVEALSMHARLLRTLQVAHYRAVATSAVRDSRNGADFIARAREAGISIDVITGAEEARLVHAAVAQRMALDDDRWVLADLGGGSVEVSLVNGASIEWTETYDMGAVRLLEELAVAGDDPAQFQRRLEEYTATLRIPGRGHPRPRGFIATGGNIETLAKLARSPEDERGVARLPLEALRDLIHELARRTPQQRSEHFELRDDRADVILPAALVYERLCVLAEFDAILVPNVGVKDGVLLDVADDVAEHGPHGERQEQSVYQSALHLGRRYRFDEPHARQVTSLALSLFDQLQALHGLGVTERRMLIAGSLLHDVGMFIAYRKHHKHSQYIIAQSNVAGFTPVEIEIVAHVARYHRKGEPSTDHETYMALSAADRERVRRLAAILRIADGLDREHLQNVRSIATRADDRAVTVHARGQGDMVLEAWAVDKKRGLFEQVFDRKLRVLCEQVA